jgi:homoserine kinase
MNSIKVFSPASVSNVCCGFDVLGFSIDGLGDELIITKSDSKKLNIKKVNGYNIPLAAEENTASVAAQSLLDFLNINHGFDIEINKNIKPGSGIGSSAASAVGAVYGINKLLGSPLKKHELLKFAMQGEFISSKTAPADNIASSLYGGLILVNNSINYNVIELPVPKNLYAVIHHPLVEIKTSDSRKILPPSVDLNTASNQLSSIAGFVHSLHTKDFDLMKLILKDYLVENYRSDYIPLFKEIKNISKSNDAICCSISGSGPSIFSLVNEYTNAKKLQLLCDDIYTKNTIEFKSYVTGLNSKGVHII